MEGITLGESIYFTEEFLGAPELSRNSVFEYNI